MKSKVIALLELAASFRQIGLNLIRVAILIVFVWIGGLKFNITKPMASYPLLQIVRL